MAGVKKGKKMPKKMSKKMMMDKKAMDKMHKAGPMMGGR